MGEWKGTNLAGWAHAGIVAVAVAVGSRSGGRLWAQGAHDGVVVRVGVAGGGVSRVGGCSRVRAGMVEVEVVVVEAGRSRRRGGEEVEVELGVGAGVARCGVG